MRTGAVRSPAGSPQPSSPDGTGVPRSGRLSSRSRQSQLPRPAGWRAQSPASTGGDPRRGPSSTSGLSMQSLAASTGEGAGRPAPLHQPCLTSCPGPVDVVPGPASPRGQVDDCVRRAEEPRRPCPAGVLPQLQTVSRPGGASLGREEEVWEPHKTGSRVWPEGLSFCSWEGCICLSVSMWVSPHGSPFPMLTFLPYVLSAR